MNWTLTVTRQSSHVWRSESCLSVTVFWELRSVPFLRPESPLGLAMAASLPHPLWTSLHFLLFSFWALRVWIRMRWGLVVLREEKKLVWKGQASPGRGRA
jgi:hypothetical protein